MNKEWSLDALYTGYDSPEFIADRNALTKAINDFQNFVDGLTRDNELANIKKIVAFMEEIELLAARLLGYLNLRSSADTTNSEIANLTGQMEELISSLSKAQTKGYNYISNTPDILKIAANDADLKDYQFAIDKICRDSAHRLSEEVEEVIAKMNNSAASAWTMLQQYATSTVTVPFQGKDLTLSDVRNLAWDKDASIRKEAYEAELAAYDKIKDSVCFSLNNIKSQVNTICELRAYESPLAMTLSNADLKPETLDALLTAIQEYLPKFREYLKAKGKLLGSANGLAWYDMFAPVGEFDKTYSLEEAKDLLISLFREFSDDLADMVTTAFDDAWIDFYPRKGKVGGAFCQNLPFIKQSRVLTNFDGSLSSVVTLAHELGHAYHGLHIQDHRPLNTEYSMQVAETASTFNENIIMDAVISKASDKEKLTLLESQLQDATQIIVDIYSRFLFEKSVFEARKTQFLFPNDLCSLMVEAQEASYGDGLDESTYHPYMWLCKSHYYDALYNYYNFPYAFGGLFAKGLYEQYKKEGSSFVPKYQALLHATTVSTSEEVAAMAGIDITKPDFWRSSLESIAKDIDTFVALVNQQ